MTNSSTEDTRNASAGCVLRISNTRSQIYVIYMIFTMNIGPCGHAWRNHNFKF
jgi:hypothetical protein